VIPYSDFTYFGLLLYLVIPTIVAGLFGRANAWWALGASALALLAHFYELLPVLPGCTVREIWIALGFLLYQGVLSRAFLRWKSRPLFYATLGLAILPLAVAKFLPSLAPGSSFGFLGISYVTFRVLDVIFSIQDGVIKTLPVAQFCGFVFFFPTLSSGPIDRFRRFQSDWLRRRDRAAFLVDLDHAISRLFRGFLYKFILSVLIKTYWLDRLGAASGFLPMVGYMYAYALYLFFDFAGYSAFAIALSSLFGIRTPENFDLPFLSRNLRDFWNRWHISLSFWFRDHVYMRFLLAAGKGRWFAGKFTASYLGLFLTFGLMGIWHGPHLHYLLYGLYHAVLLCSYDRFARWNKLSRFWPEGPAWRLLNIVLTFHVVSFGLLIFSGRLTS
jgi:membrane protein involved in D-alanine export